MKYLTQTWAVVALYWLFSVVAVAQGLPRTEGKTLADKSIVLAEAVKGKPALLIITFSKAAGEKASAWTSALQQRGLLNAKIAFYQVAELEDVPRLFRGIAISGMRKGIPGERHANFVVLTNDTEAWKTFVSFEKDELPYLVLLDANSKLVLRLCGDANDSNVRQIAEKLKQP